MLVLKDQQVFDIHIISLIDCSNPLQQLTFVFIQHLNERGILNLISVNILRL